MLWCIYLGRMTIRVDGEATCSRCGTKARCTVDLDLLVSNRFSSPGASMRGLPDWFYKQGPGNLTCTPNLACSEKCVKVLGEDTRYAGDWKKCEGWETNAPR